MPSIACLIITPILYFVITLLTLCYESRRPGAAIPLDALTLHSEVVLTRLTELC